MLTASLENALVVSLFQFLVAGLLFLVLCVSLWRGLGRSVAPPDFRIMAVVFFLLSGHLLLETFDAYLQISRPDAPAHFFGLHFAVAALETIAFLCLIPAYHPRLWGVPLALLPAIVWTGGSRGALLNAVVLAVVLLLSAVRKKGGGWFSVWPVMAALASTACRVVQAAWMAEEPWRSHLWTGEKILMLSSLVLFALVVEQRTQSLYAQIFVRLNLIFILVASSLVLVMAEAERKQFLELEQRNLQDLSEFIRGHVLYFHRQGQLPQEILGGPEIIRKVVSEFGKIPDLRTVRVFLEGLRMEMSIAPNGVVDHSVRPGAVGPEPAPSTVRVARGERISTLLALPIYYNRLQVGRVELDETLSTIHAAIGRQVRSVVVAFTFLVLVSGLLISLTVRDANRTIRRQYQEINRTNQQLLQAAKLASVGELVGGMAHEINNPVGVILARADYMREVAKQHGDPAELVGDLEVMRRQAKRISEIVGGLLTFSRPSALQVSRIHLNQVLEQSRSLVAPQCHTAGVTLCCCFERDLPWIQADPDRLEQVFVNILNNAIDAMPRGGKLTVGTEFGKDRTVVATISDTGVGIAEEHLPYIFDPFFSTKKPGKGTGLGLAVSYGIVRDHGGEIRAASAVGRGSTFTVSLPIKEKQHGVHTDSGR